MTVYSGLSCSSEHVDRIVRFRRQVTSMLAVQRKYNCGVGGLKSGLRNVTHQKFTLKPYTRTCWTVVA